MENITAEEIAKHYTAMGHSVFLITDIIDGNVMQNETDEEKKECVSRNVKHLELMKDKDYWTDEDMTSVDAAISAGNTYIE